MARADVKKYVAVAPFENIAGTWELGALPRSLGNSFWAWLPAVATYDDPGRPYVATLVIDLTEDGTPVATSISIESRPPFIRPGDERLPLSLIFAEVLRRLAYRQPLDLEPGAFLPQTFSKPPAPTDLAAATRQAARAASPRRGRRALTPERLQQVADAYRNPPEGASRRNAVADALGVSENTAHKYIDRARTEGYLGKAPGERRGGEAPKKRTERKRAPKKKGTP